MEEKTYEEQVFEQEHELDTDVKPVELSIEEAIKLIEQQKAKE